METYQCLQISNHESLTLRLKKLINKTLSDFICIKYNFSSRTIASHFFLLRNFCNVFIINNVMINIIEVFQFNSFFLLSSYTFFAIKCSTNYWNNTFSFFVLLLCLIFFNTFNIGELRWITASSILIMSVAFCSKANWRKIGVDYNIVKIDQCFSALLGNPLFLCYYYHP